MGEYLLTTCARSDGFRWFESYNPGEAVSSFEQQVCKKLNNSYPLPGEEAPGYLALSIAQGSAHPAMGRTMRPVTVEHL